MQKTLLAVIMGLLVATVALMVFSPALVFAQEHQDATDLSNSDSQLSPQDMEGLIVVWSVVVGTAFVISYVILFVIIIIISGALKEVPSEYRVMEPGQVWLLLIPCFAVIWNFWVFQRVPQSFHNYFASQGRTDLGDCGGQLGLWYAICGIASVVPCLNYIAGPAALVLLIIFLVKIVSLKKQIQSGATAQSHPQ
ncbi:MAG TPA: hypothetical protein QF761_16465 [Pirellulales bacterium]|jgi:hypothetical protein|nr:hypothetical protein [Pirellulales bacterium]